jgi:hypothetical protein
MQGEFEPTRDFAGARRSASRDATATVIELHNASSNAAFIALRQRDAPARLTVLPRCRYARSVSRFPSNGGVLALAAKSAAFPLEE